jgi:hypothetical protein
MEAHSAAIEAAVGHDLGAKFSGSGAGANVGLVVGLENGQRDVVRIAYASSLREMWILYACTAAVGLVASAFIGKQSLTASQRGNTDAKRRNDDLELQDRK